MKPPVRLSSTNPLDRVFAYRAIDLYDRFPQPFETFREALECLQSDHSYIAMSGEIIAYLRGGYTLIIPRHFYLRRSGGGVTLIPLEENDTVCAKVEEWLQSTLALHDEELSQAVSPTDQPYSLEQLLQQCDIHAPEPEGLKVWRDMPDIGREVLERLNEKDVWEAAERVFGAKEKVQRWMTKPLQQLEGRSPEEALVEDPQQVYDLLIRIEHGVCS